ncbi:Tyrocidine synthase III [Agrobacterium sp. DSM 25558]|uniref:amino acid adenylation domain-containing protein n=1 Tax=Agrobacterium sp. DSM 25558 TaxID=1907665 RepID=UPI00097250A5|nr:amino acid adenylation domain-containing protein [Agrobacterium sp. DSM 25558]SCX28470.1 Tyrocidine synthase III [Agrobacterium sp. DSM 25558]
MHATAGATALQASGEAPESRVLADLLLSQTELHPNKVAAVSGDEELTFGRLSSLALSVGSELQEAGAEVDTCIGIFSTRNLNLLVGIWGAIFSGAAYLPLAPDYPDDRLRFMIEDAKIRIILAEAPLISRLKSLAPPQVIVLDLSALVCRNFLPAPHTMGRGSLAKITGRDLAYVIYTSGSSGKPKGVMIDNRSIVHQMQWLSRSHGLDGSKTVLQKTPISFDAAQWELLASACGATVVMAPGESHRDPIALISEIQRHSITTLQCVPTMLKALLDVDLFRECATLRQVFSGGEVLSTATAKQFFDQLSECELINLYGPTECTINASSHVVNVEEAAKSDGSISIGKPVDGMEFFILDSGRKPVTRGETGELFIGGIQLARGYVGRTDLTEESFIFITVENQSHPDRLYRTGDLARWNDDGTVQFIGRADNQIKLRGFRIELDEIKLAIERHDWVRSAAVIASEDPLSHSTFLTAFIELSPTQAAVMDQGISSSHHHSKASRLQVRAQIANLGLREAHEIQDRSSVLLPGKEPTIEQISQVFQRKTYRFYDGGDTTLAALYELLSTDPAAAESHDSLAEINLDLLGFVLRYFGQFNSEERLLPKYGYASPGALYATQLYVEARGIPSLEPGYYYYHPSQHTLVKFDATSEAASPEIDFHFIGKRRAIEPIYKTNVREVLEFEAGHMVGLLDRVLANSGLGVGTGEFLPEVRHRFDISEDHVYLGSFPFARKADQSWNDSVRLLIQPHGSGIPGLAVGLSEFKNGRLTKLSDEIVEKHDVIAINQKVYERSQFAISLLTESDGWRSYMDLGRKLQHLQMNALGFGFMSSGYSSRDGHDLGSARRLSDILSKMGSGAQASYFAVGGRVSQEQIVSKAMKEDAVHMRGPAELIKDDLSRTLPAYMMPTKIMILNHLPLLPNGKVDSTILQQLSSQSFRKGGDLIRPRSSTEDKVAAIWKDVLKVDDPSVDDDFFEAGGNSLTAVILTHKINVVFNATLPIQTVFEAATIERLAQRIEDGGRSSTSRIVRLSSGPGRPIFCWPGLGGYPLSLRTLASQLLTNRPFFGIQAYGLNESESPFPTISAMATADIEMIREVQPFGPYTLSGYSFGARIAFETAYQLERGGFEVDALVLIAPGSPKTDQIVSSMSGAIGSDDRAKFATILLSVFTGTLSHPMLREFLSIADDDEVIAVFLHERFPELDFNQTRRIVELVRLTYGFRYDHSEIFARKISTPITIIKASGDDHSFLEAGDLEAAHVYRTIDLTADHYGLLRSAGATELADCLEQILKESVLTNTHQSSAPIGKGGRSCLT